MNSLDLVLGTAQLTSSYGVMRRTSQARSEEHGRHMLGVAAELGFAAIDTAPAYGEAEGTIGSSPTRLPVHTKLDRRLSPAESVHRSLRLLRRTSVELVYIHDNTEILNPQSSVVAAASKLVGREVRILGASIYSEQEFDAALAEPRIGAIQAPVNLFDRHIDRARLAAAAERGVRVYARSVLLQGVLVAEPQAVTAQVAHLRSYVAGLQAIARRHGRSPLELALGWVRSLPGVHGVVIGAESANELTALVAAFRARTLQRSELEALETLTLPPPESCDPRHWSMA